MTKTASTTNTSTSPANTVKFARIMTPEGENLYFDDVKLRLIAGLLKAGRPIALIGEPGSGKSALGRAILFKALQAHGTELAKTDASIAADIEGWVKGQFFQMEFAGIISGDALDGKLFAA